MKDKLSHAPRPSRRVDCLEQGGWESELLRFAVSRRGESEFGGFGGNSCER